MSYNEYSISQGFSRLDANGASSAAYFSATQTETTSNNHIANEIYNLPSYSSSSNHPNNTHSHHSNHPGYLSEIESAILRADAPLELHDAEEITVNGERGLWANKAEVVNWRGEIPISEYLINQDQNPEIITKRTQQRLEYVQELAIRYLRPPTPPAPGEIVITESPNIIAAPAPPLIIRQQPPRPDTPEPLIVREAPPEPPSQVGRKVITISGKRLPPPPRKVVIERLAPLPSKPQSVIIERWLPYPDTKRRVIFQRSGERDPTVVAPRNVIVQWEAPEVNIRKEFKFLGVIRANPIEYAQRYGSTMKHHRELPRFVLDIPASEGFVLAADHSNQRAHHELEGDVHALKLIDLEREGLGEYRNYLNQLLGNTSSTYSSSHANQ